MSKDNIGYLEIVRPQVLKRDGYVCKGCGVRNKTRVYLNSRNQYQECDEFIEEWAKSNGKKVFTVGLMVVKLDITEDDYTPENLVTMCTLCAKRYNRKAKKYIRRAYVEKIKACKGSEILGIELSDMLLSNGLRALVMDVKGSSLDQHVINEIINIVNKNK